MRASRACVVGLVGVFFWNFSCNFVWFCVTGIYLEADFDILLPHQNIPYETTIDRFLQGSSRAKPIRIAFDSRIIDQRRNESSAKNDLIDTLVHSVLPLAAEQWSRHLSLRTPSKWIEVKNDACGHLQVHKHLIGSPIFYDADVVIIVSADPTICNAAESIFAQARPCRLDQMDRPVIGAMNICLDQLPNQKQALIFNDINITKTLEDRFNVTLNPKRRSLSLVNIVVHEIAHVLGQAEVLFKYFRDDWGYPRTERNIDGSPMQRLGQCSNGTMVNTRFPSFETVRAVNTSGRVDHFLITPRVQRVVQNHFDCFDIDGARLDNDGRCIGTHWHERHYFGNLLSPILSNVGQHKLMPLTLALMEDTGWYQVNYKHSSPMTFGAGAGCSFVRDDCIVGEKVPLWGKDEFCSMAMHFPTRSSISVDSLSCDPSHRYWTLCDLFSLPPDNIFERSGETYFPDKAPLMFQKADQCPIPVIDVGLDCSEETPRFTPFYPGESVGSNSRCLNAFYFETTGERVRRPACMPIQCTEQGLFVGKQLCEKDGQSLPVPGLVTSFFICPRLATICPEHFGCPNSCSGRGKCVRDTKGRASCLCDDAKSNAEDCSIASYDTAVVTYSPTTDPVETSGLTDAEFYQLDLNRTSSDEQESWQGAMNMAQFEGQTTSQSPAPSNVDFRSASRRRLLFGTLGKILIILLCWDFVI